VEDATGETSNGEDLGNGIEQTEIETTCDTCWSIKVRVCNGLGTQDQLELSSEAERKVITGVSRTCQGSWEDRGRGGIG